MKNRVYTNNSKQGWIGDTLKQNRHSPPISWKLSIQFPCSLPYATLFLPHIVCCFPPVCLNVVFVSLSRNLTAALPCSYRRKVISHSVGHSVVTGVLGNKKAGTQMRTDSSKGQNFPLVCLVSHSCNRL